MAEDTDHSADIAVLNTRLDGLEAAVRDIGKAVRTLVEQPRALPLKEVLATFLATAGLVAYLMSAMNAWYDQKSQALHIQVQRLNEQDKNGELAVLKYRVQQLEAARK